MSANNLVSQDTLTVPVLSAATRTTDTPVVERGIVGVVAETVTAASQWYPLHIAGEFEFTIAGNPAVGATIYITSTNTLALTSAAGSRPFGVVTQVPTPDKNNLPAGNYFVRINAAINPAAA